MRRFISGAQQKDMPVKPEDDYRGAKKFRYISVGEHYFFYRWLLFTTRCIPIKDIARCYIRVDSCTSSCCCGKATFNSRSLIVVTLDGRQKKLWLDDESTLKSLIEELKGKNNDIVVGCVPKTAQPAV